MPAAPLQRHVARAGGSVAAAVVSACARRRAFPFEPQAFPAWKRLKTKNGLQARSYLGYSNAKTAMQQAPGEGVILLHSLHSMLSLCYVDAPFLSFLFLSYVSILFVSFSVYFPFLSFHYLSFSFFCFPFLSFALLSFPVLSILSFPKDLVQTAYLYKHSVAQEPCHTKSVLSEPPMIRDFGRNIWFQKEEKSKYKYRFWFWHVLFKTFFSVSLFQTSCRRRHCSKDFAAKLSYSRALS